MATTYTPKFLKRTASQAQFDSPVAKKSAHEPPLERTPIKQAPLSRSQATTIRFPKLKWDLQRRQRLNGIHLDQRGIQSLLTRSIVLALEAVGFEKAEAEALEAFRDDVEEYMAHFLASVQRSMLTCRRIQTLPQDFLQALHEHQLSLRALLPHADPPVSPSKSQFSLKIDRKSNPEDKRIRRVETFMATSDDEGKSYIPGHFPKLPSQHTYKGTPDKLEREHDPRKIRERATEEGRLGEEALRRLVAAASEHQSRRVSHKGKKSPQEARDDIWRETMEAVGQDTARAKAADGDLSMTDGDGQQKNKEILEWKGHLGSAVNAERRYWRTPKKT